MNFRKKLFVGACALVSFGGGAALATGSAAPPAPEAKKKHDLPVSKDGNVVVGLCDGETTMEVAGVKEGQGMSREKALEVTGKLMDEWRRKNPNALWDDAATQVVLAQAPAAAKPNAPAKPDTQPTPAPSGYTGPMIPSVSQQPSSASSVRLQGQGAETGVRQQPGQANAGVQAGQTYGAYTERDTAIWAQSTQAFVEEGNRVFHDAKAVGGTISVSCDMCHPDAANTHPETYPKYQVQLGRVALLRDMINWCIENPVRGTPLADDDPRMKAMEAFIYAKRKGTQLDYGKH